MNELVIASKFDFEGEIISVSAINNEPRNGTYLVETSSTNPNYILQQKSRTDYKNVPDSLQNIQIVSDHIKQKQTSNAQTKCNFYPTLIQTKDHKNFLKDTKGNFWVMREYIDNTLSYQSVESEEVARAGGKAIGQFQVSLGDLYTSLTETQKGNHDIRHRFEEWNRAIKNDSADRVQYLGEEIKWIESRKTEMIYFWKLIETGLVPKRIALNNTDISNILFSYENEPLCLTNLDDVSNSTVLNDFGDAVRLYTNSAQKGESTLESIAMDMDKFKAFTEGYLEVATPLLNPHEIQWLAFSARYIVFEQVLCYLKDYIEGDKKFAIEYEDQNLARAREQHQLLLSMEKQYVEMKRFVIDTFEKHPFTVLKRQKRIRRTYKEIHYN